MKTIIKVLTDSVFKRVILCLFVGLCLEYFIVELAGGPKTTGAARLFAKAVDLYHAPVYDGLKRFGAKTDWDWFGTQLATGLCFAAFLFFVLVWIIKLRSSAKDA